mgnify:CR=1 FL=1
MTDQFDERAREIAASLDSALSAWRLRDLEAAIAAALRATAEAARREAVEDAARYVETHRLTTMNIAPYQRMEPNHGPMRGPDVTQQAIAAGIRALAEPPAPLDALAAETERLGLYPWQGDDDAR